MNKLLNAYEKQLPKYRRLEWNGVIGIIGSFVGIISLVLYLYYQPSNPPEIVYSYFLIFLASSLLAYVMFREYKAYDRYSESILHIYYVQKIVKRYITSLDQNDKERKELQIMSRDIINIVSKCFSLLKSKNCNVSIKKVSSIGGITTFVRDSESESRYADSDKDESDVKHTIDNNTDFEIIKNSHKRYFVENNLPNLKKIGKYKNSSFELVGDPDLKNRFGFIKIDNWNLLYRSTMVVPIRYLTSSNDKAKYYYFGFLCIDSNSRNIFNKTIDPELAMIFADILCGLMSEAMSKEKLINEKKELMEEQLQLIKMLEECTEPQEGTK